MIDMCEIGYNEFKIEWCLVYYVIEIGLIIWFLWCWFYCCDWIVFELDFFGRVGLFVSFERVLRVFG